MTDRLATVNAGLALLDPHLTSDAARRMLIAIGQQESGFATTVQYGGPAHSFWQMEGGPLSGIAQVMLHASDACKALCAKCGVAYDRQAIYAAMALADKQDFAAAMARLLLRTDPLPLGTDEGSAWSCYVRNWHPGKPSRERWVASWALALNTVPLNAAVI